MPEINWIFLIELLIKGAIIVTLVMLSAAVFVYLERKISARIQLRIGPNRVGPFGLLQPFADVAKLFMKEDIVPDAADSRYHAIAAIISLGVAMAVYAVIPFGTYIIVDLSWLISGVEYENYKITLGMAPNVNIGLLFVLAMTSVGVYGLTLAGWSSNNKYSLLGGLRAAAQMISYELSMGLSLVGVIMIVGSMSLTDIVAKQGDLTWFILLQPLGFIVFLVSSFAETNRAPFDLPEAEPELVGGFNTEYTGMRFGMFFLAEYGNMATASAMITLIYLGGWHIPFLTPEVMGLEAGSVILGLLQVATVIFKVILVACFFIWVRWSIPRFRYDQLMNLGWKVLLPLSLLNVVLTAIVIFALK
jgi:NADH-quinone oxidoreductase subunit H